MVNQWKSQAENKYSLGITDSSEATMLQLQRVRASADLSKTVVALLLQKAAAEKTAAEQGSMSAAAKGPGVVAAVSAGAGSACAIYTRDTGSIRIDFVLANTQAEGQSDAQRATIAHILALADKEGVPDVRLSSSTVPALFFDPAEMGFAPAAPGSPSGWLQRK